MPGCLESVGHVSADPKLLIDLVRELGIVSKSRVHESKGNGQQLCSPGAALARWNVASDKSTNDVSDLRAPDKRRSTSGRTLREPNAWMDGHPQSHVDQLLGKCRDGYIRTSCCVLQTLVKLLVRDAY